MTEVRRHVGGGGHLAGPGGRGRNQDPDGTGAPSCFHVGADVAHDDAPLDRHTQIGGGRVNEPRLWFAAAAALPLAVQADPPDVGRLLAIDRQRSYGDTVLLFLRVKEG